MTGQIQSASMTRDEGIGYGTIETTTMASHDKTKTTTSNEYVLVSLAVCTQWCCCQRQSFSYFPIEMRSEYSVRILFFVYSNAVFLCCGSQQPGNDG